MLSLEPRFHGEPPLYLTSALLADAGLPHLFTTRRFPLLASTAARGTPFGAGAMALLARAGLDGEEPAFLKQVHGADVLAAERGGLAGRGDVLTTDRPGLPLAIFTADCLPVVVYDPEHRRLAVAHTGWRGTVQRVAPAAVQALVSADAAPGQLIAAVGPSIGPCCYEVDAPVIALLEAAFPGTWRSWVEPTTPGKWMLDLWRANYEQLVSAGLDPARIDNARLCTACHTDLFFSYRRARGQGRLVTVAAIPPRPRGAC